jgi:hypothetical protein
VKYSVTFSESATPATPLNPTIARTDSTGSNPATPPVAFPWSEEFTFTYLTDGYDNQFVPEMTVVENLDEIGDSITITISWKDYKTNFEEEVLASYSAIYGSSTISVNETLFGPLLPK